MEATEERRALVAALDAMERASRRAEGASQLLLAVLASPSEPEGDALEVMSDVLDGISRDLVAACGAARGASGGGAE